MFEAKPDNPDEFQIVTPLGEITTFAERLEAIREQAMIAAEILNAGDQVYFHTEVNDDEYETSVFEIEAKAWEDLSIFHQSEVSLSGKLSGAGVPEQVDGKSVIFIGSSWGGTMLMKSGPMSDMYPCFLLPDVGQFSTKFADEIEIKRINDQGLLASVSPNLLNREAYKNVTHHADRLQMFKTLAAEFHWQNKDASKYPGHRLPSDQFRDDYDDDNFASQVEYGSDGAITRLAVINKLTNKWYGLEYDNRQGKDLLKVASADVSKDQIALMLADRHRGFPLTGNAINIADAAITTFITSQALGMDSVHHLTSPEESQTYFATPGVFRDYKTNEYEPPKFSFVIHDKEDARLVEDHTVSLLRQKHPDSLDKIIVHRAYIPAEGLVLKTPKGNIRLSAPPISAQEILHRPVVGSIKGWLAKILKASKQS